MIFPFHLDSVTDVKHDAIEWIKWMVIDPMQIVTNQDGLKGLGSQFKLPTLLEYHHLFFAFIEVYG